MSAMSVSGAAREDQVVLGWTEDQPSWTAQMPGRREDGLAQMLREAHEKADEQRERFQLAKAAPRYGDAPLEAYARLSRARSQAEVNAAAGYARRRILQLQAAQRADPDHADQIRAAVGQLKKAVGRAGKKKLELNREQLARARQKRMAQENRLREEQRLSQELRRSQTMRAIRESGYFREAEIDNRLAQQLGAARADLQSQARELGAAAQKSLDAAVRQYAYAVQTADADLSACVPQVDVQA